MPSIKYAYVPNGMKLQTLKLRLMHITFYTIQQPFEIMHNLYPNSQNYFQPYSWVSKCIKLILGNLINTSISSSGVRMKGNMMGSGTR